MAEKKTMVKCSYITRDGNSPPSDIKDRVNAEIISATTALKRYHMVNTNLDFRQSAVRERLDKCARHIDQHRRLELAVGKKVSPSTRKTANTIIDEEAEAICSSLDGLGRGVEEDCPLDRRESLEW